MAFVNPCVPPEARESLERQRAAGLEGMFSAALAYYPPRLAQFRDRLKEEGFDDEQSASMAEVFLDHLLAATLGAKP